MRYLRDGTEVKHEIHVCFIHALYLQVILYNVLTATYHMKSDVEFFTCVVMLAFKKFWISDHFQFWEFQIRIAQH
jgi:hypothetical protein